MTFEIETAAASPRLFMKSCGSVGSTRLQTCAYASRSGDAGRPIAIASGDP